MREEEKIYKTRVNGKKAARRRYEREETWRELKGEREKLLLNDRYSRTGVYEP